MDGLGLERTGVTNATLVHAVGVSGKARTAHRMLELGATTLSQKRSVPTVSIVGEFST